ncbi:MAG: hypothetical protein WEB09_08715 [Nitriliruptor sp.]
MLSTFTTTYAAAAPVLRHATTRARTSPRRSRRQARTAQLLTGLVAVGTGVALLIRADLGVASWDVLHVALSTRTGATVGTVSIVVSIFALALGALLRERPRLGTLVPVLVIAPTIDVALRLFATPDDLIGRSVMLLAGLVLLATGVGAYIASDHGAGPGDLVFLGIVRHGMPVGAARVLVDGTAAGLGWLLGGPVGVGTVVITLALGPMISLAIASFDLTPSREETGRRDRAFHREVALELHHELEGS